MSKKHKDKKVNRHLERIYANAHKEGVQKTTLQENDQKKGPEVVQAQATNENAYIKKEVIFALTLTVLCVAVLGVMYYVEISSPFIDTTAKQVLDAILKR